MPGMRPYGDSGSYGLTMGLWNNFRLESFLEFISIRVTDSWWTWLRTLAHTSEYIYLYESFATSFTVKTGRPLKRWSGELVTLAGAE